MQIIKAEVMGMCFGVRDALQMLSEVAEPKGVTIHGELVHNESVLAQLSERGFQMAKETARRPLPMTDTVLVTAHGVSNKERQRLEDAGKRIVDTTCPLVKRAHEAAQKLQSEGRHVLVIGKRGHVEIQGIIEDLLSFDVIESPDEVRHYAVEKGSGPFCRNGPEGAAHQRGLPPFRPDFAKLGIMCQTTSPARLVQQIRMAVTQKNPDADIRYIDTVCHPTKDHQKSLEALLEQVQAVVVVGGRNSNNTRELVVRCREHGLPAFHVQGADDLDPTWFEGLEVVGLTAGTSTLDETIDEVDQALSAIGTTRMLAIA